MPLQSRRISLSALGIEEIPGMRYGNHLRIGFDPPRRITRFALVLVGPLEPSQGTRWISGGLDLVPVAIRFSACCSLQLAKTVDPARDPYVQETHSASSTRGCESHRDRTARA